MVKQKKISRISFGAMRLPKHDEDIDTEKSAEIIKRAYELVITYFNTVLYCCNSQFERIVGRCGRYHGYPECNGCF